jgi:pimeloyl-ACP methyl ester carboxylesterase
VGVTVDRETIERAIRPTGARREETGTMAFMERNGFRLYHEDTGGNGPVLLFPHGAGGNHLSWWQQVPVFTEEHRLIWPELSEKVHRHVPGSRFVRVEMAGHSTYFERPDVFNREVGAFLETHRPEGR